jgi:signal transduction histidine kinase
VENDLRGIISYNLVGVGSALTITELRALTLIAGQCGVALDKIEVYEKLRKADRLAAIGGMTAAVAHEIKNPLGSMKGAVQLLADSEIPTDSREYVRIISEEINRLNGLVQDFLQFARPLNLEPAPEVLPDIIGKSVDLLKRDSRLEDVEVVVKSDENIPEVNIDAEKIRQVIINLVMNAAESMNWSGRIEVKSELQPHLIDTEWIFVSVTDNGPGVPEEAVPRLFEPFFTTRTQGSGLGLAISRQIIEGHGGRLRLDTEYKNGARFLIELPLGSDV